MSVSSLLSEADRRRLRSIVAKVHLKFYPEHMLTTYELDKFIDAMSERVIEAQLKEYRDSGAVD